MSTSEDTDPPEDEPTADSEPPAEPARRGRPLSDAFAKVPHFKVTAPSDLPGIRAMTENLTSLVRGSGLVAFHGYRPALLDIAESLNKAMLTNLAPALTRLSETIQNLFPPNWGDARPRDWDEFKHMLAHEGIPVLWVPGPEIIAAIFEAETPADRRRVISSRWKGIVTDCETVLVGVTHDRLADEREFALDCVRALRDGHTRPAQAFAANLLDSVMQRFISKNFRRELTNNEFKTNGVTFDFDDYSFRLALTFAPVWCAHARYKPWDGDPIPADYVRHASVHGVSRRQYKRINAVIALMLVTSVIKFFDDELTRRGK